LGFNYLSESIMPNYFTGNADLLFHFNRLNLEEATSILESGYSYQEKFPFAPKNYHEALENYRNAMVLAGDIAGNFIEPRSAQIDMDGSQLKDGKVTYAKGSSESYKQLADAGFTGTILPYEYGGLNFPATIYMMLIELVSRADAAMMTMIGYQDIGEAISKFGTKEVCEEYLPKYISGEHIGSMVMTEPAAGSDLQGIQLKAYQDDEGNWFLKGNKHFISNGCGDMLLVLARSEEGKSMFGLSLFACHGGEKVNVVHVEEKMGLHGSPTCQLYFDDAPVKLVGRRKQGLLHVLYVLNHARFSVAAQALGIAEAAYHEANEYAKIREQFNKIIYKMSPVANMLIDMRVAIESSRSLLYAGAQWLDLRNNLEEKVAHLKAKGQPFEEEKKTFNDAAKMVDLLSPLAKYVITEMAVKACYDAQQIHGGMGYMREMKVERLARDVRITTIYEGTSQIHILGASKNVINDMLKDFFEKNEKKDFGKKLLTSLKRIKEIRVLFLESLALVKVHESIDFRTVAAKELVDMYGYLYTGYLLLNEAYIEERKVLIANRYINSALAKSHASLAAIKNNQYNDLENIDEICNV